jgi:hypothetical protein
VEDAVDALPGRRHAVHVDVLLRPAVRGPHADELTLVADDVDQLVLPEEPGQRRVALAPLLAR